MNSTALDTRLRLQIASTISNALGISERSLCKLSLREMFVLCQQAGFEVEFTVDKPLPPIHGRQFVAEIERPREAAYERPLRPQCCVA